METIWTVEGDWRFFSEKPTSNLNTIGGRMATRSSDFSVIVLRSRSGDCKLEVAKDAKIFPEKLFIANGLLFRVQDKEDGLRTDLEEIWDPANPDRERQDMVPNKSLVCWLQRGIVRKWGQSCAF